MTPLAFITPTILVASVVLGILAYLYGVWTRRMSWPAPGDITSEFGFRSHPITGKHHFHNGVDIRGGSGDPVTAPYDGVVQKIYSNETGGLQLIIRHDNGWTTGYAHLSRVDVNLGDRVSRGQRIAAIGVSGRVTGPHLHFTIKNEKGEWINPESVLT